MLKKMLIQAAIVALSLISSAANASEGKGSGFFGLPKLPSRPPLPNLGLRATRATTTQQELPLFIEYINESGLSSLAQRFPNITRIVLMRMGDEAELTPEQVTLLQNTFPQLAQLELSSDIVNDENLNRIRRFPGLKLLIQEVVQQTQPETPRAGKRPKREREEESSTPRKDKDKEPEEESKPKPKKPKSSSSSALTALTTATTTTSSSGVRPPQPPKSKSDTALLQLLSGKLGQTVKGTLGTPRRVLRAIRKGSRTSSSSTSSSSNAPFDLIGTLRQNIQEQLDQAIHARDNNLGFNIEDTPGEARNYASNALEELAFALTSAKKVLDSAQAGVTGAGEFDTIISNLQRSYEALESLTDDFGSTIDPDYVIKIADYINKAVRAFGELSSFAGDYEASEKLAVLRREVSKYR